MLTWLYMVSRRRKMQNNLTTCHPDDIPKSSPGVPDQFPALSFLLLEVASTGDVILSIVTHHHPETAPALVIQTLYRLWVSSSDILLSVPLEANKVPRATGAGILLPAEAPSVHVQHARCMGRMARLRSLRANMEDVQTLLGSVTCLLPGFW